MMEFPVCTKFARQYQHLYPMQGAYSYEGSMVAGKVTEGVSGQQGVSGHGPSFRSLGAVFAYNCACTALESSKVGYARTLTIIQKNC